MGFTLMPGKGVCYRQILTEEVPVWSDGSVIVKGLVYRRGPKIASK